MRIELTEPQQQALDAAGDEPVQVVDPRTKAVFVLLRAEDYESLREILEEERGQKAIASVALRNAAGRMNEEP
jgi:PHD/YefM family antitoxin component YafN of YafNO toxin-antitoxin module